MDADFIRSTDLSIRANSETHTRANLIDRRQQEETARFSLTDTNAFNSNLHPNHLCVRAYLRSKNDLPSR